MSSIKLSKLLFAKGIKVEDGGELAQVILDEVKRLEALDTVEPPIPALKPVEDDEDCVSWILYSDRAKRYNPAWGFCNYVAAKNEADRVNRNSGMDWRPVQLCHPVGGQGSFVSPAEVDPPIDCGKVLWVGYIIESRRFVKKDPDFRVSTNQMHRAETCRNRSEAQRVCNDYNDTAETPDGRAVPWPIPVA